MKKQFMSDTRGFSLIELMIAMLIGLIVLNGVIQLVINSKRTYIDNQAISQIQENARFAVDILSRELRLAGYVGCMPINNGELATQALNNQATGLLLDSANTFNAVEIFNDVSQGDANLPAQIRDEVKAGSDVLIVRHTDPDHEWFLTQDLVSLGGNAEVTADTEMAAGAPIALVSHDCANANLLKVSSVSGSTITANNASGSLLRSDFKKGSRVTPIQAYAYYIGTSSVVEGNVPALKRERLVVTGGTIGSRSEELAVGIDDLQLTVAAESAGVVTYEEHNGSTPNALAIRAELNVRSHKLVNPPTADDPGYIEKPAVATVRIRNQG